jgi:hypothetical protein
MAISVALAGSDVLENNCCAKRGYIPFTCLDGTIYWQLCFFCANVVKTIILPQAVLASNNVFYSWVQTGFKDGRPGTIRFDSADGHLTMHISLDCLDGLYYCHTDVYTVDPTPYTKILPKTIQIPRASRVTTTGPPSSLRRPSKYTPVSKSKQLESKFWLLQLGSPGISQLDLLPGNVLSIPAKFDHHPFRFIDFKAQARVRKQAAQRLAVCTPERKQRFYMYFGYMRASASNYSKQDKLKDRVVYSYDGFSSYLLMIDKATRYIWVFLTSCKDPQLDIVEEFLRQHGHEDGGCIWTDQGGELARSIEFQDMLLWDHYYTIEPTGSDSSSQNGAVEIYNDKFGVRTRTLLYGSGLPAKYWSAALCHAVFLHNHLVHDGTKKTPFKGYYGMKPDLSRPKLFSSRVCAKQAGNCAGKLDRNDFTGVFLGYLATSQNMQYINLTLGIVKTSHHADFDEAWYLQPHRPLAAQLLYNLGLEYEDDGDADKLQEQTASPIDLKAPWPPCLPLPLSKGK